MHLPHRFRAIVERLRASTTQSRVLVVVSLLFVALLAGGSIGFINSGTSSAANYEPTPSPSASVTATTEAAEPTGTPSPESSASPTVSPRPEITIKPTKPKKPKPATRERKARNVPERPLDKNTGRRIVYDKSLMTVWVMNKDNEVVYRFPIVGRWDRPVKGKYRIYSKSERSGNPNSKVTFDHMTRFAYGMDGKTPIGFHSIPRYYDGSMMHSTKQLGLPIATGGCVRMAAADAKKLYKWSKIGDLVVVLPSP